MAYIFLQFYGNDEDHVDNLCIVYHTCFPSSFTAGLAEISSWAKARAISLILPVTISFILILKVFFLSDIWIAKLTLPNLHLF